MLLRGIARLRSPSILGIVAAALVLFAYSSGAAVVLVLVGFPATVGGLVLYFGYGWRRALWAAAATFVVLFVVGAIDTALGPGNYGGGSGGGLPSAGAR